MHLEIQYYLQYENADYVYQMLSVLVGLKAECTFVDEFACITTTDLYSYNQIRDLLKGANCIYTDASIKNQN